MKEVVTGHQFTQISAGAYHVLAIEDGKCYGWGSFNRGQLAQKPAKGKKIQLTPKLIPLPGKVQSVTAGSLFSTALL